MNARDAFIEATSVDVTEDADWGGVESLEVTKTESTAEAEAREAEEARQEAAAAASRSAARQAQTTTTTTNSYAGVALPTSVNGPAVAAYAQQFTGVPYVWGGNTTAGWDCSGFTSFVYAKFGISMPRTDSGQRAAFQGKRVSNPEPGDLMWNPGHVGIYIGNGMMVHAANPGQGTLVQAVYADFEYYRIV